MALLAIQGLNYFYGTRQAVKDVSFTIEPGEVFGLLGANGAGKTTTISCIAGLLSGYQGQMLLRDQAFRPSQDQQARRWLGVVPQELAIYENLSGYENLKLFANLYAIPTSEQTDRIREMLDFAGLDSRSRDRVSNYSGGMKRRLNLVIGMMHRPALLLLDEPTVGVDPQSRNHLFDSIQGLRASGMSMLYTTHYMEEAQRLCDRIAIMNEGAVIAVGTVQELAQSIGESQASLEQVFLQLTGRSLRDE